VTIFLTTQYLDEADQLADRVAVLDKGKLVAEGTPQELKRRIPGGHVRLQFTDATVLANAARIFGDFVLLDEALALQIPTDGGVSSVRALLDQLDRENIEVEALTVHTADLDDVYFALTGHPVTKKEATS
jgi:ABC-2 type transport system ATP-binding protein